MEYEIWFIGDNEMKIEFIRDKLLEIYIDIPELEDLPDSMVYTPKLLDELESFMISNYP